MFWLEVSFKRFLFFLAVLQDVLRGSAVLWGKTYENGVASLL